MKNFEICHFRRVSCIDQGFKSGFYEGGHTTAEYCLLAKEVGLGLFAERGLKDNSTGGTDTLGIC